MALILTNDPNTGIELQGLYFRIDKINFNDYDFQVVMTGYASEQSFKDGKLPIIQPKAYTFGYDKNELANMNVFEFAYSIVKLHDDFKEAVDHL